MAMPIVSRAELESKELPLMLQLVESASKYGGEVTGGGQKTPTTRETHKTWKTWVDDGTTWNQDHHWVTDYD